MHASFIVTTLLASVIAVSCTRSTETNLSPRSLPEGYEAKTAEEKSEILFKQVEETKYESLPPLLPVNVWKFVTSPLLTKMTLPSDEAPQPYEKAIHARAVVAKVSFEVEAGTHNFTGLFQGVPFGILRLSVTSDPKGRDFAPGLALKFLIDGQPSHNLSALYKLSGQGPDHNFFAHELSNIIPFEIDPKSLFSSTVFRQVSRHPTKVAINPLAEVNARGENVSPAKSPVQIYFVPTGDLKFASEAHDFREDFLRLEAGKVLYEVYATEATGENFREIDVERRKAAVRIGRIVSRSQFVASEFGDQSLFFRHFRFEDFNRE